MPLPLRAYAFQNALLMSFKFITILIHIQVCCAAGLAVMDEVERLRGSVTEVGDYLMGRIKALSEKHSIIGDVRGRYHILTLLILLILLTL
jgi:4-aminobutyrate aminotransferase-like enzyme